MWRLCLPDYFEFHVRSRWGFRLCDRNCRDFRLGHLKLHHQGHQDHGITIPCPVTKIIISGDTIDEPHGSLFVYFRIFAPLADDHVITSHVTGITRPIPTFSDQLQWFPLICNDLRWFLPLADVSRALRTQIGYHVTLRKFYSSVKQLPRTPACQYIKIARLR